MRLVPYHRVLRPAYVLLISSLLISACGGGGNSTASGQTDLANGANTATQVLAPIPPRITNARGALLGDGELRKTNGVPDTTQAIREAADKSPSVIPRTYALTVA